MYILSFPPCFYTFKILSYGNSIKAACTVCTPAEPRVKFNLNQNCAQSYASKSVTVTLPDSARPKGTCQRTQIYLFNYFFCLIVFLREIL